MTNHQFNRRLYTESGREYHTGLAIDGLDKINAGYFRHVHIEKYNVHFFEWPLPAALQLD